MQKNILRTTGLLTGIILLACALALPLSAKDKQQVTRPVKGIGHATVIVDLATRQARLTQRGQVTHLGLWTDSGEGVLDETFSYFVSGHGTVVAANGDTVTHVPAAHTAPGSGPLADGQTLELRADLISASQNDAFAGLAINYLIGGLGNAYLFCKDEDELWLMKVYDGANFVWFFYTNQPLKNQNVTLVLALTRAGTNLNITTRVLDKDNSNSVLFERTVMDTPKADPVLPSRTFNGVIGMAGHLKREWEHELGKSGTPADVAKEGDSGVLPVIKPTRGSS